MMNTNRPLRRPERLEQGIRYLTQVEGKAPEPSLVEDCAREWRKASRSRIPSTTNSFGSEPVPTFLFHEPVLPLP